MRSVVVTAILGSALSLSIVEGQNTSAQPSAGAPAQPAASDSGAKEAKPKARHGRALTLPEITEATAAEQRAIEGDDDEDSAPPAAAPAKAPAPTPVIPTVQAAAPGPAQKNLTGSEFALIHVGSTAKEVLNILGPPSSRVVVPDDDDHLRETLQYWIKGAPAATIRLDNGHVAQIETRPR